VCRALEELHEDPARIGAHWLAAGEPARAVGPLHEAAARRRALGDVEAANVALALSEQALRALDRAGGDPRWFDQHLEVARAALELDDVVAARSALERAARHETPQNRTTLALERARLSRRRGLAAETRAILEGALRHPNDVRDEAMVRAALGKRWPSSETAAVRATISKPRATSGTASTTDGRARSSGAPPPRSPWSSANARKRRSCTSGAFSTRGARAPTR
jgi:tetratricopeptide (TPR) repeat protein